ncbi:hypothetical protein [Parvibaculum sp.]|uniref:hypothetical protein n=1 Tax=Parvibaculum sp. TaxID=2024848 RepID=UPI001B288C00|nr:hypothetical protein [Parvibaculum sp.]MBO6633303.1 hypothetical protein [Parvibaculum sp.]MBO6678340.1 hypothetical protein [Parvibaculum sp.]MBO6685292.1 hypothetical protein [Parvibaculum sp.]MBO6904649.1 hypothetical protein [Parvibaculum sp.]
MKKLLIATAILLATTMGAHADGASSAQTSADFSGAVVDSAAKGTAIAAISVAMPVLSAAGAAVSIAGPVAIAGSKTLHDREMKRPKLTVTEKTVVTERTVSPDAALKARLQDEEI